MPVSEQTYEQVALEDPDGQWELVCGRLRRKPGMPREHNGAMRRLNHRLAIQLDEREYLVSMDGPPLRISTGTFYRPDLCVIPLAIEAQRRETPGRLEVYTEPLPLVVEVWSPSTREYDTEEKLREYQWRGDLEIWRLHPYERTLTIWRHQPDASYRQAVQRGGIASPATLPNITVDLDSLFD